ncbi:MAG: hypothetical protein AAFV92_11520, partial [Pseudomonadota bacterium]
KPHVVQQMRGEGRDARDMREHQFVDQADPTAPTIQVLRKGPLIVSIQRGRHGAEPIITVTRDSDEPIDKT